MGNIAAKGNTDEKVAVNVAEPAACDCSMTLQQRTEKCAKTYEQAKQDAIDKAREAKRHEITREARKMRVSELWMRTKQRMVEEAEQGAVCFGVGDDQMTLVKKHALALLFRKDGMFYSDTRKDGRIHGAFTVCSRKQWCTTWDNFYVGEAQYDRVDVNDFQ